MASEATGGVFWGAMIEICLELAERISELAKRASKPAGRAFEWVSEQGDIYQQVLT